VAYHAQARPYRPLDRIDANTPVAPGTKPMDVEVVALDWKWLFIYPEQKIATVNELVLPEGRPSVSASPPRR
jgi:cytochrome o ubiquinol oxidase subunit 2